jgi:hydrogenase maturation protein HypF
MASAMLHRLGRSDEIAARFPMESAAPLTQLLRLDPENHPNCPPTSSLGRLFDAAAGLLGVCFKMNYEAEASMRLEALANRLLPPPPLAAGWTLDDDGVLDLLPLFECLADESDAAYGAALFHSTLTAALTAWVRFAARHSGIHTVALGGGCCSNRVLSTALHRSLTMCGFIVLEAREAPPNDGGLALGQAHVARLLLTGEN